MPGAAELFEAWEHSVAPEAWERSVVSEEAVQAVAAVRSSFSSFLYIVPTLSCDWGTSLERRPLIIIDSHVGNVCFFSLWDTVICLAGETAMMSSVGFD